VVTGLFYGGGLSQLGLQALGSFSTVAATLSISLLMMFALKSIGVLRVSKAGELEGLDLHEHGAAAYPEYALAGAGTFSGGHFGNNDGRGASGEMESITIGDD
jgi:Amt family ammonium transporter